MKNVNLTQLYLDLIDNCDVIGFDLSSMRKIGSKEPSDVMINFIPRDITKVNVYETEAIIKNNITGDVKQIAVKIIDDRLNVYVEFIGAKIDDNYAY